METVKQSGLPGFGGLKGGVQSLFRAVKIFCMVEICH